jgi:hypothetical protein
MINNVDLTIYPNRRVDVDRLRRVAVAQVRRANSVDSDYLSDSDRTLAGLLEDVAHCPSPIAATCDPARALECQTQLRNRTRAMPAEITEKKSENIIEIQVEKRKKEKQMKT